MTYDQINLISFTLENKLKIYIKLAYDCITISEATKIELPMSILQRVLAQRPSAGQITEIRENIMS